MNNGCKIFLIIFIFYHFTQAQIIKRDEKVRFSFGLAKFTAEQVNDLPRDVERVTEENNLGLPLSGFDDHLVFQLDYESHLWARYYYAFSLQYTREIVSNKNNDQRNQIDQGLEYSLTLLQGSVSLVHYFPIHVLQKGSIDIVAGAGLEILYANADLSYVYSQLPVEYQKIEFLRTGFIPGARIFLGLEAPMIPSILLELRTGFSFLPEDKLTGKVKSANLETPTGAIEPIDPDVFNRNVKYNFCQLWLTFGLAYFF